MKLKMCRCHMCRYGLRHSKKEKQMVTNLRRSSRHKVKRLIHAGRYGELPVAVSVPYIG